MGIDDEDDVDDLSIPADDLEAKVVSLPAGRLDRVDLQQV